MKSTNINKQKLLEMILVNNPDFVMKSKIKAIEEDVKQRARQRNITSPLTNQERILLKH